MPFEDAAKQMVHDDISWHRSRNQQRNWETLKQLISLRVLPNDITDPWRQDQDSTLVWSFEFDVDRPEDLGPDLRDLKRDCEAVPMLVNLDENQTQCSVLLPDINIWFEAVPHK